MDSIDIRPNSQAQLDFFNSKEYEVLFGGSSFGGKTWCMVVDPLTCVGTPDYTAGIFRRSYPELEGQIVPLTMKYYPHFGGKYNDQKKLWTFPSGATIKLGYLQFKDDWRNHMGMDYTDQYFDEASNIHWQNMEMLKTWNRTRCRIKPRRRFASNPGGISHANLKAYFIDKCTPVPYGERQWSDLANMWWQPVRKGQPYEYIDPTTKQTLDRQYIPARVFDNVDGLKLNPGYLMQLLALPTERRKAYLDGDWGVFEGQFFSSWSPDIHIQKPISFKDFNIPMSSVRGGLDYGNTTVLEVSFRDYEGNVVTFAEYYNDNRQAPSERFEDIAEFLKKNKLYKLQIIHDTDMASNALVYAGYEKNPLSIAREVFRQRMGSNAPILRVVSKKSEEDKKYRVACNEAVKDYMHWMKNEKGEFTKHPRWFVTSDCKNLIRTLPELIHDPDSLGGLDFDKSVGEGHCFAAGTQIETSHGSKNIEDVGFEDRVLTRDGFQNVIALHRIENAGTVKYKLNNSEVVCTPDHPFFTDRGFVMAKDLKIGDVLLSLNMGEYQCRGNMEEGILLNLMGSNSEDTPIRQSPITGIISEHQIVVEKEEYRIYIERYGRALMEKFQKITMFTIRTAIRLIIRLRILNVLSVANTYLCMQRSGHQKTKSAFARTWKKFVLLQSHGERRKRVLSFTKGLGCLEYLVANRLNIFVSNVNRLLYQPLSDLCFATIGADKDITIKQNDLETHTRLVKNVEKSLSQTGTIRDGSVQEVVLYRISSELAERQTVYNLTVGGLPEYFANGFLVHNCYDAFKMGFMDLRTPSKIQEQHEVSPIEKVFNKIHDKIFNKKSSKDWREL